MDTIAVRPGTVTIDHVTVRPLENAWISNTDVVILANPVEVDTFAPTIDELTASWSDKAINVVEKPFLTIDDLGWSEEKAARIRGLFSAFIADWEDSSMDIFDEY